MEIVSKEMEFYDLLLNGTLVAKLGFPRNNPSQIYRNGRFILDLYNSGNIEKEFGDTFDIMLGCQNVNATLYINGSFSLPRENYHIIIFNENHSLRPTKYYSSRYLPTVMVMNHAVLKSKKYFNPESILSTEICIGCINKLT